ncbi:jupiter microtubule associated homolog 1-like [Toxorhynchites rutilus septentrionalis]|uniref:jupiter microtubule associated homolog 1-like n=1 Tax=Toxorhynchites rutilus septentrionalis TaxID=329112 RepID=UPI00247B2506|nr:jupiter microtubule associated homolog 1-like [Toxorhynchites rutilus septentrionalis]
MSEFNVGLPDNRNSSRVLKPPGGGNSDIFGPSEVKANPPRPKYNQQNSSNMNNIMGTADPGIQAEQAKNDPPPARSETGAAASQIGGAQNAQQSQPEAQTNGRARVPPGGFSSGLW